MKGLNTFRFEIFAVKIIVKVSATLLVLSYQFIDIVIELKDKNVVLPPTDPVADIVYTISLSVQFDNVDVILNEGITYEPNG